jgi:hypothetical protein
MDGGGSSGSGGGGGVSLGAAPAPAPSVPGRHVFSHEGRVIYEWEQSLDEVLVYVRPPPGVKASHITCSIKPSQLTLGLKGAPPFLDEPLAAACVAKESFWNFEGGELTLTLTKAKKGETWASLCVGHGALDAAAETEVHKKMLLERFGQEHPGFDFSGAEVSGAVPDPREFMGGVRHG